MAATAETLAPQVEPRVLRQSRPAAHKAPPAASDDGIDAVMEQTVLSRLLAMARRYQAAGNARAAMDLYWELAEDHHGTAEGSASRIALLDLAARYERDGAVRMARGMYERILADVEE